MLKQDQISVLSAILLLCLSAWVGGKLFWLGAESFTVLPWTPQRVTPNQSRNIVDLNAIKQGHLFGRTDSAAPVVKHVVNNAPETRLNLRLVGVVASNHAQNGLAVIEYQGSQSTYGVRETIEGTRAAVMAVFSDRVIIDNAGRDETLMLQDVDYSKSASSISGPSVAPRSVQPDDHVEYDEHVRNDMASSPEIDTVRAKIGENPKAIFDYVRLSQFKRDGRVMGYRLSPGRSPELFQSVGLEKGDIALKLNGIDLTSSDAMADVMSAIKDVTELTITVERDGQPHEIIIEFQ